MSDRSAIEWTDATWNPVTGCTKVGPGCDNCYAQTFSERWQRTPGHYFEGGFTLTLRPNQLDKPLTWHKPRRIFVNSMSDLFHKDVSDDYIAKVWTVMAATPQHTYQILTKRHARMRSLIRRIAWRTPTTEEHLRGVRVSQAYVQKNEGPNLRPGERVLPNVWVGVSVEDQHWADIRVPTLLETPAAVRFVSAEPLLGPVDLSPWLNCAHDIALSGASGTDPDLWRCDQCGALLRDIFDPDGPITRYSRDGTSQRIRKMQITAGRSLDWVIAGGESGPDARPMHPHWPRNLRNQCIVNTKPFFFKQWGGWTPDPGAPGKTAVVWPDGHTPADPAPINIGPAVMRRAGKKTAGRLLDGRTWDEFPGVGLASGDALLRGAS